jgi:[acyl-carrier-protein] S-malonyltransferase
VANASAEPESDPDQIRRLLGEQLTSPVRWIETIQQAKEKGVHRLIELGPGRVLKGLTKRIEPSLEVLSFERVSDLEGLETAVERV